ncbi:hypothetical protein QBC36DRAFT_51933 [Triangularia setosa]|uniref:Uncharacterized protein n=1 Tax=Triangularia setosa TaxID=2587417 RepID=A0AAN6WDR3_9PEZI|nr:hypothetical protein QBC36DRAFT_51933 [Podospora setosa]
MSDPNEISLDLEDHQIDHNYPHQDDENAEIARLMGFSSFTTTARTRRPRPSSVSDEHPPSKRSRPDEGPTGPQVLDGIHPTSPRLAQTRASCSSIINTTNIDVDISPSPTDQRQDPFVSGWGSPTVTAARVDDNGDRPSAAADDDTGSLNQGQPQESGDNPSSRGYFNGRGRGNFNERGGRGGARGSRGGSGHKPSWYVDYYDSRSNENPWESLEKRNGLESVGTWLERKPYQPRGGQHQQQEQQSQGRPGQQSGQQPDTAQNENEASGPGAAAEAKVEAFLAAAT